MFQQNHVEEFFSVIIEPKNKSKLVAWLDENKKKNLVATYEFMTEGFCAAYIHYSLLEPAKQYGNLTVKTEHKIR